MDLTKLLSSEQLFDPNPGPPSLAYSVLAFLFAVVLGAGIYLYINNKRLFGQHKLKARLANQMAITGIVLGLLGLVLVSCRFLLVPYLSLRLLIYLVIVALVVALVYYAYYLLRVFPSKLVAYESDALRRRYVAKRVVPPHRPSRKKGKRRK